MKKLEGFIQEHNESFNSFELPEGHMNRFQQKLNIQNNTKPKRAYWFSIAAGFAFLILLSVFLRYQYMEISNTFNENKIVSLSDISPKYKEVENFYKTGLDEKITEFEKLNCKIDIEQKKMVDTELKQLDNVYTSLQKELKINQNDTRIINAMINNYQNKIQFLELVIDQIKDNC